MTFTQSRFVLHAGKDRLTPESRGFRCFNRCFNQITWFREIVGLQNLQQMPLRCFGCLWCLSRCTASCPSIDGPLTEWRTFYGAKRCKPQSTAKQSTVYKRSESVHQGQRQVALNRAKGIMSQWHTVTMNALRASNCRREAWHLKIWNTLTCLGVSGIRSMVTVAKPPKKDAKPQIVRQPCRIRRKCCP